MHERLKAAQAVQITNGRSVNRQSDMESIKLLQEVGKGGESLLARRIGGQTCGMQVEWEGEQRDPARARCWHACGMGLGCARPDVA